MHTYLAGRRPAGRWWDFFRRKLREGRQGYVIAPLVDESDQFASVSLEETYETLANGPLEAFRLGLVHGRMTPPRRTPLMDAFRRGEIPVLVCTSVVEVGVDVPNATLMTIESGHRFGLAQLHQLRGRMSRGQFPGFCCVLQTPQTDDSPTSVCRRLSSTTDGFQLAEQDFQFAGRATCSAPSSTGCRRCGLPTCCATTDIRRGPPRRPCPGHSRSGPCTARTRTAAANDVRALRQGPGAGRRGVSPCAGPHA